MKFFTFFRCLLASLLFASCAPQMTEDQKFGALAHNFIESFLAMNPEWATSLGDHRYDSHLSDYSLVGVQKGVAFARKYLDSLAMIRTDGLTPDNRIDYKIMKTNLESWLFSADTLKEHEWNPLNYNPGGAIYNLLAREFAPLKDRLMSVKGRLEEIPNLVVAAKANLKNPPRVHTETAIQQNTGTISLIRDELKIWIDKEPTLKDSLAPVQAAAVAALESYGKWLQEEVLPRANGDFRLGSGKYERKLAFSLESDMTKEEILKNAEDDLRSTQEALYQTALPLYRKMFPRVVDPAKLEDRRAVIKGVLDKLAESHPTNDDIVEKAMQNLKLTTDFVRAESLVTVPETPVKAIVMPEFQRGVATAYCDAAGPLEKNGETFFAISPTPKDWTKERAASFFREYNDYMLHNLTIHEAMPGHYLQLIHSHGFKAPTMIRAIFGSGTFVEGWATYAEQLMTEKGYGGSEVRMQQLKMRLRLIINAIIDQKIHTARMTEREGLDLMMNGGYQEEGEAAGKWRRACLTSTQLSTYYVGNLELNGLARAYKSKHPSTDLKSMHDAILSVGSPAPKYVKESLGL